MPRVISDSKNAPQGSGASPAYPGPPRGRPRLLDPRRSDLAEGDGLRAFPERAAAELLQLLLPLDERGEVVRPKLAGLRGERAVPVGEEQLGLALTARVESELARMRIRRRVLRADPELPVAPRDPVRLAAPAAVDDPIIEREDRAERGDGVRRELLLEAGDEAEVSGKDLEHHGVLAPWPIQRPRTSRSDCVIPVAFPSGIALVATACCSISSACDLISAAVSSSTPLGATSTFVGWAEWHAVQRSSTIRFTCANGTDVPAAGSSCGRIKTASAAIATAAVTGIAQTVRPACRRLKKCRTHAPITTRTTRISHA